MCVLMQNTQTFLFFYFTWYSKVYSSYINEIYIFSKIGQKKVDLILIFGIHDFSIGAKEKKKKGHSAKQKFYPEVFGIFFLQEKKMG